MKKLISLIVLVLIIELPRVYASGTGAVTLGTNAGTSNQGDFAVALGQNAGEYYQGNTAVALGCFAGYSSQGSESVAVGYAAGYNYQGNNALALGSGAGEYTQGSNAVALGCFAGLYYQGKNAIAIGNAAGYSNQLANSIILNASGYELDAATSGFYVDPIRSNSNSSYALYYNPDTAEVTYGSTLAVAMNPVFVSTLAAQITGASNSYGLATTSQTGILSNALSTAIATTVTQLSNSVAALTSQNIALSNALSSLIFSNSAQVSTTNHAFIAAIAAQLQAASNNYGIAVKQNQTLNFPAIAPLTYSSNASVKLAVTSSAGLQPVTYSVANSAIAVASNNVLHIKGAGSTMVTASQAGNALYNNISASQTLTVNPIVQRISFPAIPPVPSTNISAVTVHAVSSAKLPITYFVGNEAVATIATNNILTILGTGTTTVTATNAGTQNYSPAGAVQTLIVK